MNCSKKENNSKVYSIILPKNIDFSFEGQDYNNNINLNDDNHSKTPIRYFKFILV